MKKKAIVSIGGWAVSIVVLIVLVGSSANGQYELGWYTIDGGGGRSIGGQFELVGTIGQFDAAYSSGGGFELMGGFWPGGPLCFVDFESFARFAEYWLWEECDEGNDWCNGADLDHLYGVNELDLKLFVEEWLCYCPAGWPLK